MNNRPISSIMQTHTLAISFDDSVHTVETFLTRNRLSWAPVIGDRGEPVGVISAFDLMRFHANEGDSSTAAWRLCTYKPLSVDPQTTISEVARAMVENNIHHVVVTEQGNICGVVSALDFVRLHV